MKGIPTPQDYLQHMQVQPWMNNGVKPIGNKESEQVVKDLLEKLREESIAE